MLQFTYLAALLFSIGGLAVIDWRHGLAFWNDRRRTLIVIAISVTAFIIWDILGMQLGIFFHGGSSLTLPFRILPELPVEEIFFLILLSYSTLIIYRLVSRLC